MTVSTRHSLTLPPGSIPPPMSQPPFHDEGQNKSYPRDRTSDDKKWLEDVRPNIGYIRNIPFHANVMRSPLGKPSNEHCK